MDLLPAVDATLTEHGDYLDCCVMVAYALAKMAGAQDTFKQGTDWWEQANVWDATRPYSSLNAAAEVVAHATGSPTPQWDLRLGPSAPTETARALAPGVAYVVQGWRSDGSGHTFFLLTDTDIAAGIWVVESSSSRGFRLGGVRWKERRTTTPKQFALGRLREFDSGLGIVRLWDVY